MSCNKYTDHFVLFSIAYRSTLARIDNTVQLNEGCVMLLLNGYISLIYYLKIHNTETDP